MDGFYKRQEDELFINIRNEENMKVISEHSALFYASKDHALKLTIICTVVAIVFHAISRIQGRVRTSVHGGLHLFWSCLVVGELAVCLVCLAITTYTYARDNGHPSTLICTEFSPLTKYCAYAWLIVWVTFVVAVLRGTVAITWLNRIRDSERLADMARGIGILCLSLIYLFPLALLSRFHADDMSQEYGPITVCAPAFDHGVNATTVQMSVCVAWLVAVAFAFLASVRFSRSSRCSRLAFPLVMMTHFAPTMMFFIWISNTAEVEKFRDCVPALFASATALSAICNFFTYKLFPLATQDAELPSEGTACQCSDKKNVDPTALTSAPLIDIYGPPPMYVEKCEVV